MADAVEAGVFACAAVAITGAENPFRAELEAFRTLREEAYGRLLASLAHSRAAGLAAAIPSADVFSVVGETEAPEHFTGRHQKVVEVLLGGATLFLTPQGAQFVGAMHAYTHFASFVSRRGDVRTGPLLALFRRLHAYVLEAGDYS